MEPDADADADARLAPEPQHPASYAQLEPGATHATHNWHALHGLHGLHGWYDDSATLLRAPQGTAFTRWAQVPALEGPAEGTALFVAAAALTSVGAPQEPPVLRECVRLLHADTASARVLWTADGTVTHVAFTADSARLTTGITNQAT
jgi:hypothetical protein